MVHCRLFPIEVESVREARRFVRQAVADVAVDSDAVELLTGEIAANAVVHARTDFEVRVVPRPDAVRVEVVNDRPEMIAAMRDPDEHGGRGLRILNGLARDWGSESRATEKVVWFEVGIEEDVTPDVETAVGGAALV